MVKKFLKFWNDPKRIRILIACAGIALSFFKGYAAYEQSFLTNGYGLKRNPAGQGAYQQELYAYVDDQEPVSVMVTVEEQWLTEEEAYAQLDQAEEILDTVVKGENESLRSVTRDLNLPDTVEGTAVTVDWMEYPSEYMHANGVLRTDKRAVSKIEVKLCAILSCQEYSKDYERTACLIPQAEEAAKLEGLLENSLKENQTEVLLPQYYKDAAIKWRKPLDKTFLLIFGVTVAAVIFLHIGEKRDRYLEKERRREQLEADYAKVVSEFTMLLSAGLSIRNAWERIVHLNEKRNRQSRAIEIEMSKSLRDLHKGVSELEVYEEFGRRIEEIHYKKLMALFISQKRRGSVSLLEAMNQEMLQAWEEQKRKIRQQGEKIGTKLLLPMMGMLFVVFLMILIPAFLSFQL